jgi:hypothetical protein
MAYPNNILLPPNAKSFGLIDTNYPYNSHWDMTWSYTFLLTGVEHAISNFLYHPNPLIETYPGQYIHCMGSADSGTTIVPIGVITIAFDTTGLFALSTNKIPGVGMSKISKDSLIIRDSSNNVIINKQLSSLGFNIHETSPQTLRFRIANAGTKLYIDHKLEVENDYKLLESVNISIDITTHPNLYPGFSFCSPISSMNIPSTLFFKNYHTQGNISPPTYEVVPYTPLSQSIINQYTTVTGVTADLPNYLK